MNRLMLCAGITRREGWVTLDANPGVGADIVASIPPLPPEVQAKQWDEVELIHGITTFYLWDAEQVLREIRSVLAPGGKLILEQPDVRIAFQREQVEWIFGDPSFRNPAHMNKWAYTPASLKALLRKAGFVSIEHRPAAYHLPARDFRMEAFA